MTIEYSLRLRAKRARIASIIWLLLAAALLVGTYASLPEVASKVLRVVRDSDGASAAGQVERNGGNEKTLTSVNVYALSIVGLNVLLMAFGGYVLSRAALIEIESAARYNAFADALCLSGSGGEHFEKLAAIVVPTAGFLSDRKAISTAEIKALSDLLRSPLDVKSKMPE